MRLRLALGVVLGASVGSSLQCGGAKPLLAVGVCTSDSDCVISCGSRSCCRPDCPCGVAITTVERDRIDEERFQNCADRKQACRAPAPSACDWSVRHRAVCRAGSCVAEEIPGGAAADQLPPAMPERIDAAHPSCGECIAFDRESCDLYRSWTCDPGVECRVAVPCDPSCCDRAEVAPQAVPAPAEAEPTPAVRAEPPTIALPKPELPKPELPEPESPKAEPPAPELPKAESPKAEPPKPESPRAEPPPAPKTLDDVVAVCAAEHSSTATDVTVRVWIAVSGETTRVEVTDGATGKLARCIEGLARTLTHSRDRASVTTRRVAIPKPSP